MKASSRKLWRLGCAALLVPVLIVGVWIAREIVAATAPLDTPHHPFRSDAARERYLELYDRQAERWPVPVQERTVPTDYGATFVRISGPAAASPMVLLHGIGGNSLQWLPNVESFAARHRVYAVDNIYDYGRSVYSREMKSTEDFVAWLGQLLDVLEPNRPVHLVGLSYGGWISARFALHDPSRLRSLVLLAPVATVRPLTREWIRRASLCALPHPVFTERFLLWLAADLARTEEGRKQVLLHAADGFVAARSFRPRPLVPPTVLSDDELVRLPDPTLFMVGENEQIYQASRVLERLAEAAPQVRTELVREAGHDLTMVQAEHVNRSVLEFLDWVDR